MITHIAMVLGATLIVLGAGLMCISDNYRKIDSKWPDRLLGIGLFMSLFAILWYLWSLALTGSQ